MTFHIKFSLKMFTNNWYVYIYILHNIFMGTYFMYFCFYNNMLGPTRQCVEHLV